MKQLKPWQIVLFVAAIGALAMGAWWSYGRGPKAKSTNRTVLVDVTTGELFEFSTKKFGVVLPERNPDTGLIALLPVVQTESGDWVIDRRYLSPGVLDGVEGDPKMLDPGSGKVTVISDKPKKMGSKR